jgi:hypothetical protein
MQSKQASMHWEAAHMYLAGILCMLLLQQLPDAGIYHDVRQAAH